MSFEDTFEDGNLQSPIRYARGSIEQNNMCLKPRCLASLAMQQLPSRAFSSATLLRGLGVIEAMDMNIEHDEEYAAMMAEQKRLLAT